MITSVSSEIRNKMKIDHTTSFYKVQDWNVVPKNKFDRVLYFLQEEDNEEDVLNKLTDLCTPEGLILVCNVPEVNKRLSNGTLKYNKDVLTDIMNQNDIKRFWFFEAKREHLFDLLLEAKS